MVIQTKAVAFDGEGNPVKTDPKERASAEETNLTYQASMVQFSWLQANPTPQIEAVNRQEGYSNYLLGSDPSKWLSAVPNYGGVRYKDLYEGIDLNLHSQGRKLEYDFVVGAGADLSQIKLGIVGVENLRLTEEGSVEMEIAGGKLYTSPPLIYQETELGKQLIRGGYVVQFSQSGWELGFAVGQYNPSLPLIIDPLIYSTYLGGSGGDIGYGIAVDASGNAFVTGRTASTNFPTTTRVLQPANAGGKVDGFVSKLKADGTGLVYSTYLGGSGGDSGHGIAVDASDNAFVTGGTTSTNFPTTTGVLQPANAGVYYDGFVSKLNPGGTALLYSTYLGGSGDDRGRGIAVDASGIAFVTGETASTDFPTTGVLQPVYGGGGDSDGFVCKITSSPSANSKIINPADLVAQLRVTPDRSASLDPVNEISYSLSLKNIGVGKGGAISLRFPLDASLTLGYASFSDSRMWVSAVVSNTDQPYLQITVPALETSQSVSGIIVFRPATGAKSGTTILTRYSVSWDDDERSGKKTASNAVRVYLSDGANSNDNGGAVQKFDPPSLTASNGTSVKIKGDFFAPNELVTLWYTDKDGKSVAIISKRSDDNGLLEFEFVVKDLAIGANYTVAGYGNRSGIIGSSLLAVT